MKHLFTLMGIFLVASAIGQINLEDKIKNKVNQRIEQKTDQAIDKTLDNTEDQAKKAAKGDKKKKGDKSKTEETENTQASDGKTGNSESASSSSKSSPSLKTYSKFDFIPGEKIIAADDFSNVAIGDYPIDWNTNSGGEIVNIEGSNAKWLMIARSGSFMPEYITDLPENFTMEYDIACNEGYSYYSSSLCQWFGAMKDPGSEFTAYTSFGHQPYSVYYSLHPVSAGSTTGTVGFENFNSNGDRIIENSVTTTQFNSPEKIIAHVSVWRQKTRLRVYVNEEKVLDLPRAFDATAKYNRVVFSYGGNGVDDKMLISNLRFAVGNPDTRSKLITEGKLVTRGILFDVASDKIKAESYGTLKDIATVLKENPDVKVKIIGHTDSDGDDAKNLDLSKRRAASVKESLQKEFGIDASRMETDGKGESEPSDKNDTPVGKANNRRVEFVKL